jgi:hypothetical protein
MTSISSARPKSIYSHGDAGLVGPLAFSLVGLLTDCLALMMQGEASLASLRFALIAGAAPMAALSALRLIDNADELIR